MAVGSGKPQEKPDKEGKVDVNSSHYSLKVRGRCWVLLKPLLGVAYVGVPCWQRPASMGLAIGTMPP